MAAAYAALVSLMHLIEQIRSPSHPLLLNFHNEELDQIQSLHAAVSFLQGFLENYDCGSRTATDGLMSRITTATYLGEDIIESYIVDNSLAQYPLEQINEVVNYGKINQVESTNYSGRKIDHFSQHLQKVIDTMDVIIKEVVMIMEETKLQALHFTNVNPISSSNTSHIGKHTMAEIDGEAALKLMDKLTGQPESRQIIPITGMGGIGKTTLAKTIYASRLIIEHFDRRAYFTVSQKYNVREMLLSLLYEITGAPVCELQSSNDELGEALHKHLFMRRYFIVLDDMWSINVWKDLNRFLPENNNGSRVMITTRLLNVAENFSLFHEMTLLDEMESWRLLRKKVFGDGPCPSELKEIGKKMAKMCKGLPLSIVVVGGILAKSRMTPHEWGHYAENINRILDYEDDKYCSRILSLSYNHLPIHLKPCFLYIGVYPEDHQIRVSELIKLWVAEGFLKPIGTKDLEAVAKEYIKDLVDRHLLMVERGSIGEIKFCYIHDLLRNFCLREAHKERFLYISDEHILEMRANNERRVVVQKSVPTQRDYPILQSTESSFMHSLTCDVEAASFSGLNLRLMRVFNLKGIDTGTINAILKMVNSYYLKFAFQADYSESILSPIYTLRNLQTLIISKYPHVNVPTIRIWEMPQLRHVKVSGMELSYPQRGGVNEVEDFVLENLQTLSCVNSFHWVEDAVKRIPNIKKLEIMYWTTGLECCLQNLSCLKLLQSLHCTCFFGDALHDLVLPHSLKKMSFNGAIKWEDVGLKIGSLPNLEKLSLSTDHGGNNWIPVEGQFCRLKCLRLDCRRGPVNWEAEDNHFPVLERLILKTMSRLKKIPSGIGDIPTLQSIELIHCKPCVVASGMKILEDQLENNGLSDGLSLIVKTNFPWDHIYKQD